MTLIDDTLAAITEQDQASRSSAKARLDRLAMPHWALGRLMDLALDLSGITRSTQPKVARRTVVVMAADHGVASEGVSLYPPDVTAQMVHNFVRGGAGINALARTVSARVVVVDMGVGPVLDELAARGAIVSKRIRGGTSNLAIGPAMSRAEAVRAVEAGIEVARDLDASTDLYATGDMGIGNTTPSSAITAVLTGLSPHEVTGAGTGIDGERIAHKAEVIARAIAKNRPDPRDALDVLAKVGGFEIGGLAGLILGAASLRKPVLIDGFISTAAALIAHGLSRASAQSMIAAHRSVERGHAAALRLLGKEPLLDLNLRLGEGTGAALAMSLVGGAASLLTDVATFEEAAVSGKEPAPTRAD